MEPKRIFAFISYNHRDVKWAKWLRRKLEWYRLPSEIHNEFGSSRFIRPVFRDRDELNSGILSEELIKNLQASKYLIVICSPNSANSSWVDKEIKSFIEIGRVDHIIPLIISGTPQQYADVEDSENPRCHECFPRSLRLWNTEHPEKSILGISIYDDGGSSRQKAFIRVVSRLLEVDFNVLWKRHKREMGAVLVCSTAFSACLLIAGYWFMVPVDLQVFISEEKCSLPEMEYGLLSVNRSEFSINKPDTTINVGKLPGYYRLKIIPISFSANRFYKEYISSVKVTYRHSQHIDIQLLRDDTFAIFEGNVYRDNEESNKLIPLENAIVEIGGRTISTDMNGKFHIHFPLPEQSEIKQINISKDGYSTICREDEVPGAHLKYIMHRLD